MGNDMLKLVAAKTSKFDYVNPSIDHFLVPEWLNEPELYWYLKTVLYDIYKIINVEIDHIKKFNNKKEFKEYCFKITGYINLVSVIEKSYKTIELPDNLEYKKEVLVNDEDDVEDDYGDISGQLSFF